MYEFFYGVTFDTSKDVTRLVYQKWCFRDNKGNRIIHIPLSDYVRADFLGDPAYGILKKIFVSDMHSDKIVATISHDQELFLPFPLLKNNNEQVDRNEVLNLDPKTADQILEKLHKKLTCQYGSLHDEYNEQRMNVRFIPPDARVLEIGGHIGRNSLVIASILKNPSNLVVIEPKPINASRLRHNRDLNGFNFHVEECAISKRRLIQEKGKGTACRTIEIKKEDPVPESFNMVTTCSWDEILQKYPFGFDTLVYDCEGAFLSILEDFPRILDGIRLILQENDYESMDQKHKVDSIYAKHGFEKIFVEEGGWPWSACRICFFEAWAKKIYK